MVETSAKGWGWGHRGPRGLVPGSDGDLRPWGGNAEARCPATPPTAPPSASAFVRSAGQRGRLARPPALSEPGPAGHSPAGGRHLHGRRLRQETTTTAHTDSEQEEIVTPRRAEPGFYRRVTRAVVIGRGYGSGERPRKVRAVCYVLCIA